MAALSCDVVQEYVVPPDVTAIRIEAESRGSGGHSRSAVTLQVRPGDRPTALRLLAGTTIARGPRFPCPARLNSSSALRKDSGKQGHPSPNCPPCRVTRDGSGLLRPSC